MMIPNHVHHTREFRQNFGQDLSFASRKSSPLNEDSQRSLLWFTPKIRFFFSEWNGMNTNIKLGILVLTKRFFFLIRSSSYLRPKWVVDTSKSTYHFDLSPKNFVFTHALLLCNGKKKSPPNYLSQSRKF